MGPRSRSHCRARRRQHRRQRSEGGVREACHGRALAFLYTLSRRPAYTPAHASLGAMGSLVAAFRSPPPSLGTRRHGEGSDPLETPMHAPYSTSPFDIYFQRNITLHTVV